MANKTICLDFDGVIHAYTSKWCGATIIPDGPVPGALDWCWRQVSAGNKLIIASARANEPEGMRAIIEWLAWHGFPPMPVYPKPIAAIYIDDNGYKFTGTFPDI